MKKILLLFSCLAMISTMAPGRINKAAKTLNGKPETLKLKVRAKVNAPIAAWWEEKGPLGSRTLTINLGTLTAGTKLNTLPELQLANAPLIYIVAPLDTADKVQIDVKGEPIKLTNGIDTVNIPYRLIEPSNGNILTKPTDTINTDGVPASDQVPVGILETALSTTLPGMAGEILKVDFTPGNRRIPNSPGNYTGESEITVTLLP